MAVFGKSAGGCQAGTPKNAGLKTPLNRAQKFPDFFKISGGGVPDIMDCFGLKVCNIAGFLLYYTPKDTRSFFIGAVLFFISSAPHSFSSSNP